MGEHGGTYAVATTAEGERDKLYSAGVPEAGAHDTSVLPHLHSESQVARLFPLAVASEHLEDFPDYCPESWGGLTAPDGC